MNTKDVCTFAVLGLFAHYEARVALDPLHPGLNVCRTMTLTVVSSGHAVIPNLTTGHSTRRPRR
jgi:hypothetical protein